MPKLAIPASFVITAAWLATASCDESRPAGTVPGSCLVALAEVGCAPSYDAQVAAGCALPVPSQALPSGGMCQGYLTYFLGGGYSTILCHYDPTSRRLVGGVSCSDTPAFCDRTLFRASAGTVVDACSRETLPPLCPLPDAGRD